MPFKINISEKGKSWKFDLDSEALVGKSVGDKIDGKELKSELEGYELEITGGSDIAGFPMHKEIEGLGLKRLLLKKGFAMRDTRKGVRLRKTVRGKTVSLAISQLNLIVLKNGSKKLSEVFPDQNKAKEEPKKEVPVSA